MFIISTIFVFMYEEVDIMEQQITHTKIYGHGAADVLKQAEVNAKFLGDALGIAVGKDQILVIKAEGNKLRFAIESREPIF